MISSSALPSGASTSALQGTTNTKLDTLETSNQLINTTTSSRLASVVSSVGSLTTANHTDLVALENSLTSMEGKIDTLDAVIDNILVKQTLATTAEDKEVIDDDAIGPETLSIAIDTENYERVRFYGNTSTSAAVLGGSDLLVYGSESSTGTYYNIPGTSFSAQTLTISGGSAVHHIGLELQNTPRFIKIFNKSNSSTYTIVKLRMVGSGGRLVI